MTPYMKLSVVDHGNQTWCCETCLLCQLFLFRCIVHGENWPTKYSTVRTYILELDLMQSFLLCQNGCQIYHPSAVIVCRVTIYLLLILHYRANYANKKRTKSFLVYSRQVDLANSTLFLSLFIFLFLNHVGRLRKGDLTIEDWRPSQSSFIMTIAPSRSTREAWLIYS